MPETLARLTKHSWLGNVRELENVIRRLVVLGDREQARPCDPRSQRAQRALLAASGRLDGAGHKRPSANALVEVLERVS
jgi:DNA-binding NtrC family response regulator